MNIHEAAKKGDIDTIQKIINSGNYDINSPNENCNTVLHLAAKNNHVEIVKLLINLNNDIINTSCGTDVLPLVKIPKNLIFLNINSIRLFHDLSKICSLTRRLLYLELFTN